VLMEMAFETDSQALEADIAVNVERLLLQYRGNISSTRILALTGPQLDITALPICVARGYKPPSAVQRCLPSKMREGSSRCTRWVSVPTEEYHRGT
jgi:hypothetical protein